MDERKIIVEFSIKTIFWVISVVFALWLIVSLKDILLALVLSFILAMAISPLVNFLQKRKVPRTLSVIGVITAVVGVIYLVVSVLIPPFISEITTLVDNRAVYLSDIAAYLQHFSPTIRDSLTSLLEGTLGSANSLNFTGLVSGAKGVLNGLLGTMLVIVLSFYLLQNNRGVEGAVVAYVPKQQQRRILSIYRKISNKMSLWLRGQVILGLIIFVVVFIGLSLLKVEYALTLAIIAGLMEVLPIIGPVVAGGLAVLVSLTQSPLLALIVLAFYVLVQQLENHILVPQVMKKSLGLNPIAVILAIIIGGKLLGFIGILISVPVAAAIGVLMEEFIKKQEEEAR
jgi:predicted PurR-regulated permease PerM